MSELESESFDVIIVGGRPAGAALATRLGRGGLRVLIVDRATFPSYPAVSTPFLLPHTLEELDLLGLDPETYAPGAPRMHHVVLEFGTYFDVRLAIGACAERSWFVVADRADFDGALWDALADVPNVVRRSGFGVNEIVKDDAGRIVGVRGRHEGRDVTVHARAVIGADGRNSRVADAASAAIVHERTDLDTHIYYAFWEGVAPYDDGDTVAHIATTLDGWSVVFMPLSRGRISVVVQAQSALFAACEGKPAEVYHQALRSRPSVQRRLEGATCVSDVHGLKRMGNLFRQAGGPGWALVGDAWHQKDSIDAQGVYDALAGARLLADELLRWHAGDGSFEQAVERYEATATAHFRPMFDATMERVKRETYSIPPPLIARTVLRWLLTDPGYAERFGQLVVRRWDPAAFLTPGFMLGAIGRGIRRDLFGSHVVQ